MTGDEKQMQRNTKGFSKAGSMNDGSSLNANREVNGNVILLRGSKITDSGHILLRTDNLNSLKSNLVVDNCNGNVRQLLIQQSDLTEGLLLHSVRRLGNGAPILFLNGNDNDNGHILIQTSGSDDAEGVNDVVEERRQERINLRTLEAPQDDDTTKSMLVPRGSGKCLIFINI